MQPVRLFHTVRYLRPGQVYGRLWHRVHRPRADLSAAPGLRERPSEFVAPVARAQSLVGPSRFRFLNREGDAGSAAAWNDPQHDKLWLYNLHYFDTLSGPADADLEGSQRALIARWIAENPVGQGNGWEPYPVSLRVVNWIKWALGGAPLEADWVHSLAVQARWLEGRLEWHLLGNHLLANAKALVFAGMFFDGPEAERWLHQGVRIYQRELLEQILDDGGHFERSPMYHAITLEDLLDVLNLVSAYGVLDRFGVLQLDERINAMRAWLAAMTHPDGGPSFFNDAAFGIAASCQDIEDYATRIGLKHGLPIDTPAKYLGASGYVRTALGDATTIVDVAPIGPDYLPGHAHADTLSFELSLGRERVIVNSGTSIYGTSAQRHLERSTAAHSTVEIDGQNSSEVWGGFRVAQRARVLDPRVAASGASVTVSASHDGYRRLGGGAVHNRTWRITPDGLTVVDRIEGHFEQAVARFHLSPGVAITIGSSGLDGEIEVPHERRVHWATTAPARVEPSQWHPEFGKTVESTMLVVDLPGTDLETSFRW